MSKQAINIAIITGVAAMVTVGILVVAKNNESIGKILGTR